MSGVQSLYFIKTRKRHSKIYLDLGIRLVLALIFLFILSTIVFSLDLPLTVSDYAGIDRINEPVTSGVPLSEELNITSTSVLGLYDNNSNEIDCQFTVTSRWRAAPDNASAPIKWVLLDFDADVLANQESTYYLRDTGLGDASTNLSLVETADNITIDTGQAKFIINKNYFNFFDYVYVDSDDDGQLDDTIISQPNAGGVELVDANGLKFTGLFEAPEKIEIEENGSMRKVVRIRGNFKLSNGTYYAPSVFNFGDDPQRPDYRQPYEHSYVYYNARMYFYNNKSQVKIFFTLENNGGTGSEESTTKSIPQHIYFDSVDIQFNFNQSMDNLTSKGTNLLLNSTDNFAVYQDWKENLTDTIKNTLHPVFDNGPYYNNILNGNITSNGSLNEGWLSVFGNNHSLSLGLKEFWQNFPKSLKANSTQLSIGLWPQGGYYPYCDSNFTSSANYNVSEFCILAGKDANKYMLVGGRHKTHEFILDFKRSANDISKKLNDPLMALAESQWYYQAAPFGYIAPYNVSIGSDTLDNEALERFDLFMLSFIDENISENGITMFNMKTLQSPPNSYRWEKNNQFFGWFNYGDMLWSGGHYSSLHYDWSYGMLIHYIRTGRKEFFELGSSMAKHRYDIDQYHGDREYQHAYLNNHFGFYESDNHADPTLNGGENPLGPVKKQHTWNGGMILYYLLTGDRLSWEAANENGIAALSSFTSPEQQGCIANGELRTTTWPIHLLLNLYEVSNNQSYFDLAEKLMYNRILYQEELNGKAGYFGYEYDKAGDYIMIDGSIGKIPDYQSIFNLSYNNVTCQRVTCGGIPYCSNIVQDVMYTYAIPPILQYHYMTSDENVSELIIRMANFTLNTLESGGKYLPDGRYISTRNLYWWVADLEEHFKSETSTVGSITGKMMFYADLLAYAYKLTNDTLYIETARRYFRDVLFYYQDINLDTIHDVDYRSTLSYYDSQTVNSATKEKGWFVRSGQIFLSVEKGLQDGPLVFITNKLRNGFKGVYLNDTLASVGGTYPYNYTLINGSLPAGMSMTLEGFIEGTSVDAGNFTFTVKVTDAEMDETIKNITISIDGVPPPSIFSGTPFGTIAAGTPQTVMSIATDKDSTCKYDTTPGTNYSLMSFSFDQVNSTTHTKTLSGLIDGQTYAYYVRCNDTLGNYNEADYTINFTVDIINIYQYTTSQTYLTDNVTFACLANSSDPIQNISLYTNISGWTKEYSNSTGGYLNYTINNIDDGQYIYNCLAYRNSTAYKWGLNISFEINEDPLNISGFMLSQSYTSAQVNWTTNKLTDSWIFYGLISGIYTYNVSSTTLVTLHSLLLSNLIDNTTYYYVVNGTDAYNRSIQSIEQTFNTLDIALIRSNGTPSGFLDSGTTSVNMTLNTTEQALCRHDTASNDYSSMQDNFTITNSTYHQETLNGLIDGNTYTYYIRCIDTHGNPNTDDYIINFTVAPLNIDTYPYDNYNSSSSDVRFVCIANSQGNSIDNITLYTNVSGWSAEYTNNSDSLNYTITSITDGTYTWSCLGYNNKSQSHWSETKTIKVDTTPPTISNISLDVHALYAAFNWTTDEASDTFVEIGTTPGIYTSNASDSNLVTVHEISINTVYNTTYYFRVRSRDDLLNSNYSAQANFTTPMTTDPIIWTLNITPQNPYTKDDIYCNYNITHPFDNATYLNITWQKYDGNWTDYMALTALANTTYSRLDNADVHNGNIIRCNIIAYDDADGISYQNSTNVTVLKYPASIDANDNSATYDSVKINASYTSDLFNVSGVGMIDNSISRLIWKTPDIGTADHIAMLDCMQTNKTNCIAIGEYDEIIIYYPNGTQKCQSSGKANKGVADIQSNDLDNDGYVDEIAVSQGLAGKVSAYDFACNLIWENSIDLGSFEHFTFADLDGDGLKDDIAVSEYSGSIFAFNTSDGVIWSNKWNISGLASTEFSKEIVSMDLNNDSIDDILSLDSSTSGKIMAVDGRNGTSLWNYTANSIDSIDVNGNHIFIAKSTSGTYLYKLNKDGSVASSDLYLTSSGNMWETIIYDLDDDGADDDLIMAGDNILFVVYDNTLAYQNNIGDKLYSIVAGDFDDDGSMEFFGGSDIGEDAYYFESNLSSIFNYSIDKGTIGDSYGHGKSVATKSGDINGDGINDMIVISNGNIYVLSQASCSISINSAYHEMIWNEIANLWTYEANIAAGAYNYTVTCSKGGYETKEHNGSVVVNSNDHTPTYSNLNGATTNFSSYNATTIQNVSNAILEISSYGKIRFLENVNFSNIDLDNLVYIQDKRIGIDSNSENRLNKSAQLTFYNITFTNYAVKRDGVICGDCVIDDWDGYNLTVNVSHFSNYTVGESTNTTLFIWDTSDSQVVYANYSKFFANLTNSSNPLNDSTCLIYHNKTGIWKKHGNLIYNQTSKLYELIADSGYLSGHTDAMPAGYYHYNITCGNISAVDDLNVSEYETNLMITHNANKTAYYQVYFYANYSSSANEIALVLLKFNTTRTPISISSADLDNDGYLNDIIYGDGGGSTGDGAIYAILSNGTNIWNDTDTSYEGSNRILVGDFDNDSFIDDIIVSGYNDGTEKGIRFYNRTGGRTKLNIGVANPYDIILLDADHQGINNDFAYATPETKMGIYNSSLGMNYSELYNQTDVVGGSWGWIAVGDLDRDGFEDDVVFARGYGATIQAYNESGGVIWNQTGFDSSQAQRTLEVMDLDNDGFRDDVVYTTGYDIHTFSWDGTYGSTNNTISLFSSEYYSGSIIYSTIGNIDLDNDGDDDFITSGTNYIFGYDNNGTRIFNYSVSGDIIYSQYLDDINSDGEIEIISGGQTGILYVVNRTGSLIQSFAASGIIGNERLGSSSSITVLDYNMDGIKDIAFPSKDGIGFILNSQADCVISFNDSNNYKMEFNVSSGQFFINRTFASVGNYTYNVTCVKNGYQKQIESETIEIFHDVFAPRITLLSPPMDTAFSLNNISLNFSATDSKEISNATLYIDLNGTFLPNLTLHSPISGQTYSFNLTNLNDHNYIWNVYACDIGSDCDFSSLNYTFTIDTISPEILLSSPTNNSVINHTNDISFKYNVTDNTSIANCSLYIDGTLNDTDNTISKGVNQTFSKTIASGNHNWTIRCFDSAKNIGYLQEFFFGINRPAIHITSPTSDEYIVVNYSTINISGTSSDHFGNVIKINWTCNACNGSEAEGNTSWEIKNISLSPGPNIINVYAYNNYSIRNSDTITIIYKLSSNKTAFTGAEGFGAYSQGGRYGRILTVSNLDDSGPGSFREAVEAEGPRIIIFNVSGHIRLIKPLEVHNPYMTIAGQTSPGGVDVSGATFRISTHDIIVTHMRFRMASDVCDTIPYPGHGNCLTDGNSVAVMGDSNGDAYNIIFDHCSLSWGNDQTVDVAGYYGNSYNVTFQNCIFAQGLDESSFENGGGEHDHGLGMNIGGHYQKDPEKQITVTVHHSYFTHFRYRMPIVSYNGFADFRNNVVYNWEGSLSMQLQHVVRTDGVYNYAGDYNLTIANFVHNYLKPGVMSNECGTEVREVFFCGNGDKCHVGYDEIPYKALYVEGNIGCGRDNQSVDNWSVITGWSPMSELNKSDWGSDTPFPTQGVPVTTNVMSSSYAGHILKFAGAIRPHRDSVDEGFYNDFYNGTGSVIDDLHYPTRFPNFTNSYPPKDSDFDGIPDNFELLKGYNDNKYDSFQDSDSDGYPNIEEYLNFISAHHFPKMQKFNGGTDVSQFNASQTRNISNFEIEIKGKGRIRFLENLNASGADIDANIFIDERLIGIDSANMPDFNKSAQITFYNVTFANYAVKKDGSLCGDCVVDSFVMPNLTINVTGFSNYTIEESTNTTLSIWDTSDSKVVYANYSKFYANLTDNNSLPINDATCLLYHNRSGPWKLHAALTYNSTSKLYETIADGSYLEDHSGNFPAGTYSINVTCGNVSAVDLINISTYPSDLNISHQNNKQAGEIVTIYANFTGPYGKLGNIIFRDNHTVILDMSRSFSFIDLDHDGKLNDFIVGYAALPNYIFGYGSNGSVLFNISIGHISKNHPVSNFIVADTDDDGYIGEFFYSDYYYTDMHLYNSSGNNVWSNNSYFNNYYNSKIVKGDFNDDGIENEIVHTAFGNGSLVAYDYSGAILWVNLEVNGQTHIEAIDTDKDNIKDSIIAISGSSLDVHIVNSTGAISCNVTVPSNYGLFNVQTIDLDSDGYDDEFIVNSKYSFIDFFMYDSNCNYISNITDIYGNTHPITPFDYDNDGFEDDFIVAPQTGVNRAYLSNSTLATAIIWNFTTTSMINFIAYEDIDTDDRKDILMGGNNGNLYVLDNSGNLVYTFNLDGSLGGEVEEYSFLESPVDFSDVNDDGINDIGVVAANGFGYVLQMSSCSIEVNDSTYYNMTYDYESGLWEVEKTFYSYGDFSYSVTCQKAGYKTNTKSNMIMLLQDTILPNVTLAAPINNHLTSNANITFGFAAFDGSNIFNATFYSDMGGIWQPYNSIFDAVNDAENQISITNIPEGYHFWNVLVCDNSSNHNCNFAQENFTIKVDMTSPQIDPVYPSDGQNVTESYYVEFLYNITELHTISSCSLYINGLVNMTNYSITSKSNASFRTYMRNGNYNYSIECFDEVNNLGYSLTYDFTMNVSDQSPEIEIIHPLNNTIDNNGVITFVCDVMDDYNIENIRLYHNLSGVWHLNHTLPNISATYKIVNWTFSGINNGIYSWGCAAMDNSSNITFTSNHTIIVNNTKIDDPVILYTDILYGPNTGGENDNGAYISIFGRNLGDFSGKGYTTKVYINDKEVADYKYFGTSYGLDDVAQLSVQIGNVTSGIVRVMHDNLESNLNHNFTVQSGDIIYVSLDGNDSTGVVNDILKPYRTVQNSSYNGVFNDVAGPGDFIVLREGEWNNTGGYYRFLRLRYNTGTAPNASNNSGPITIMGYPGEDVHIYSQTKGGIHTVTGDTKSDWIVISNLRIEGGGINVTEGMIDTKNSFNYRIVNNELFDWFNNLTDTSNTSAPRSAGIHGGGHDISVLGNHIHDIWGDGQLNHGMYISVAEENGNFTIQDYEIAYNHIDNMFGGNTFNLYSTYGNAYNVSIHDNKLHGAAKHCINLVNGYKSIEVYNNLIYDIDISAFRIGSHMISDARIYHNTIYNTSADSVYAIFYATDNISSIEIFNNIVYDNDNSGYLGGDRSWDDAIISNNLWYGNSGNPPSQDLSPVDDSPIFVNASVGDFRLQANSSAIDNGTDVGITTDFFGTSRPQGAGWDIGAFEYVYNDNFPATTLSAPSNYNVTSENNITFTCSATDDNQLSNITLYTNISGSWQSNYTNNSESLNYTITSIPDGVYSWNCLACDNASQCAFASSNRTIELDSIPPANIYEFYAIPLSSNSVLLKWYAPGDDSDNGTASSYEIRYSLNELGYDEWRFYAKNATNIPAPLVSGSIQKLIMTNLSQDTIYYFGIKAVDDAGNRQPYLSSETQTMARTLEANRTFPKINESNHPRIWITNSTLAKLRDDTININGSKNAFWLNFLTAFDISWSGIEYIPGQALTYLILKESNQSRADKIINYSIDYAISMNITFESYISGEDLRDDLLAFALLYDWAYDALNDTQKQIILDKMKILADKNIDYSRNYGPWHNYRYGPVSSVGIAAIAMHGDDNDSEMYLNYTYSYYPDMVEGLNILDDGGWHEGYNYAWETPGVGIRYFEAIRTATGYDMLNETNFYTNFGYWFIYGLRPDNSLSRGFDGDSPFILDFHRPWFAFMASKYNDSYVQWFYKNKVMNSSTNPYTAWSLRNRALYSVGDLIWYDPSIPEKNVSELPLSRFFPKLGMALMRSDWTDNATWINVRAQNYYGGHGHRDEGAFSIYKQGSLAIDSGAYESGVDRSYWGYYLRTIAHNGILIYDPQEQTPLWRYHPSVKYSDGGQRFPSETNPISVSQWRTLYNSTDYDSHDSEITLERTTSLHTADWTYYEDNGDYVYLKVDITKAYNSYKTNLVTRETIFMRDNIFVIIDKINSTNASFEKKWLLHSIDAPTIITNSSLIPENGTTTYSNVNYTLINEKSGKLFIKTLLPENNNLTAIGGSGYEYYYNNTNHYLNDPVLGAGEEAGSWRIEVEPTLKQNYDIFLNILYSTKNTTNQNINLEIINGTTMQGALINDSYAIIFSKTTDKINSTNYTVSTNGNINHLIVDLYENTTYYVYDNNNLSYTLNSTDQGTLWFNLTLVGVHEYIITTYYFGDCFPTINLTSPSNSIHTINSNITFTCSATDDNQVSNITLYTNISGSWQSNYTNNSDSLNYTLTSIPDGVYSWNCLACDNASQCTFASANRSFTINTSISSPDTTPPVILNITSIANYNSARITVYADEPANATIDSASFTISNQTFTVSHILYTYSLSPNTTYFYNATLCDEQNNCNTSQQYNFTTWSEPTYNISIDWTHWNLSETTYFPSYKKHQLQNISNVTLANNFGKINFLKNLNISRNLTIKDRIRITTLRIMLNSSALPEFNKSARLEFRNVTLINPELKRNNAACNESVCINRTYNRTLNKFTFNANEFSIYTLEELCGNNITDDGEDCDATTAASCQPGHTGSPVCSALCEIDYSPCTLQQAAADTSGDDNDKSSSPGGGSIASFIKEIFTEPETNITQEEPDNGSAYYINPELIENIKDIAIENTYSGISRLRDSFASSENIIAAILILLVSTSLISIILISSVLEGVYLHLKNKDKEMPQRLITFMEAARKRGLTYKAIRSKLILNGWNERTIFFAYDEVDKKIQTQKIPMLKSYIDKERKLGQTDQTIKERLTHTGWRDDVINKALK